jgi:hypothetical protein
VKTDAELVALLLAEARSHQVLDASHAHAPIDPHDVTSKEWQAWFRDADALAVAVQERLKEENK